MSLCKLTLPTYADISYAIALSGAPSVHPQLLSSIFDKHERTTQMSYKLINTQPVKLVTVARS